MAGRTVKNGLRAFRSGHRQNGVRGNAFQLGGVMALDAERRVRFEHRDRAAGDFVDIDAILQALHGTDATISAG